jgi:hypothetical protein
MLFIMHTSHANRWVAACRLLAHMPSFSRCICLRAVITCVMHMLLTEVDE